MRLLSAKQLDQSEIIPVKSRLMRVLLDFCADIITDKTACCSSMNSSSSSNWMDGS